MDNQTAVSRKRAFLYIIASSVSAAGIILLAAKFVGASYIWYQNAHHHPMVGDERLLGELILAPALILAATAALVIWRRKPKTRFMAIGTIIAGAVFLIRLAWMIISDMSFNW
jgi:hypothetical protein